MCIQPLEPRRFLAVAVNVDASARFQSIDGFGTSLAWWVPGLYDTPAWRDAYFKDLGSSILRVDLNILALAGPDHDVRTPVDMVENLQSDIDRFDWSSLPTNQFGGVAAASK